MTAECSVARIVDSWPHTQWGLVAIAAPGMACPPSVSCARGSPRPDGRCPGPTSPSYGTGWPPWSVTTSVCFGACRRWVAAAASIRRPSAGALLDRPPTGPRRPLPRRGGRGRPVPLRWGRPAHGSGPNLTPLAPGPETASEEDPHSDLRKRRSERSEAARSSAGREEPGGVWQGPRARRAGAGLLAPPDPPFLRPRRCRPSVRSCSSPDRQRRSGTTLRAER